MCRRSTVYCADYYSVGHLLTPGILVRGAYHRGPVWPFPAATVMAETNTPAVGNRGAITVCVILATLMQALDTTIANVALPYMQGSVSASQDEIAWVLTSYIVAAAIMTPPTGFLAGRFGLKRLFLVSVAGFTVASILCGMAQSLVQIVLFRVMQGLFGAALVPNR